MLITFKSKAAADILMYEKHAKPILDLLNRDVERGIITAAEMNDAVARLEAAIEESRRREAQERAQREADSEEDEEDEAQPQQTVSFATRAHPLLEMMRAAARSGANIMWGV
ncbi:MAG TPA: DUF1840 domain-containing protein [Noviherbaspirillum sp.]|nr:DUF1840 domain-containing protein [Noviherbaspirillum sp.]